MPNPKSEKITELRGKECKCGVSFQHIHKIGEGLKNPISVIDAIEQRLLENQKSEIEKKTTKEFCIDLYNSEGIDGEKFYKLLKEIEYDLHRGSCQKKLIDFIGLSRQQGYKKGQNDAFKGKIQNMKVLEKSETE